MFFILASFISCQTFKISHVNALLPFYDGSRKEYPYFIISSDIPVTWKSLDETKIRINTEDSHSKQSKTATVQVLAQGPKRVVTAIIAEGPNGAKLTCNVFIDSPSSFSILTTTRSIYLLSSPEVLRVQAYDDEKNVFTSIENIPVSWSFNNNNLEHVTTEQASIAKLQNSYLPSNYIVRGIHVGKTIVSATLDKRLHSSIELSIVEPIALFPPVVKTLVDRTFYLTLCSTRPSDNELTCFQPKVIPNHYDILNTNDNIITTSISPQNASQIIVTTKKCGNSNVIARDSVIEDVSNFSQIQVVRPAYGIQPEQYILLGQEPKFNPVLYDSEDDPIETFGNLSWQISGSWNTVGDQEIILSLPYDPVFKVKAIVHVIAPIQINPKLIVLPLNNYEFEPEITGGSGSYVVDVPERYNHLIVYHNDTRKLETFSNEGEINITVRDLKVNSTDSSRVIVSRVYYSELVSDRREVKIGDKFQGSCYVLGKDLLPFSVTVDSFIKLKQSYDSSRFSFDENLTARYPGFDHVYCTTNISSEKISNYIAIHAVEPLFVNVTGRASPTSRIPFYKQGGPQQWPANFIDGFVGETSPPNIRIICTYPNRSLISAVVLDPSTFSVDSEIEGTCTAYVQNPKTSYNPTPLELSSTFEIHVSKAYEIGLSVIDPEAVIEPLCNPPHREFRVEHLSLVKTAPGKNFTLMPFLLDVKQRVIVHHSAVPFLKYESDSAEFNKKTAIFLRDDFYETMNTKTIIVKSNDENPNVKMAITEIQIINPIDVLRESMLYYFPQSHYPIPLKGGSGKNTLESNYSRMTFLDDQIDFSPLNPGDIYIQIRDKCVQNSFQTILIHALVVDTLIINAPKVAAVDVDFNIEIEAYDQFGNPLYNDFFRDANISLVSPDSSLYRPLNDLVDQYTITPHVPGDHMIIKARASNRGDYSKPLENQTIVKIVPALEIEPKTIILLPGESESIHILSDVDISKIQLSVLPDNDQNNNNNINKKKNIVELKGLEIKGMVPGRVTVSVINTEVRGLKPNLVEVIVLNPLGIDIIPSTYHPIHGGIVNFEALIRTEMGLRKPRYLQWSLNGKAFSGKVLLNNADDNYQNVDRIITVRCESCSIHKDIKLFVEANLEQALRLRSHSLLLFPGSSYLLNYTQIAQFDCNYSVISQHLYNDNNNDNENNGIIISMIQNRITAEREGEAVLEIQHYSQKIFLQIRVTEPTFINLKSDAANEVRIEPLDGNGLNYSSLNGITITMNILGKLLTETSSKSFEISDSMIKELKMIDDIVQKNKNRNFNENNEYFLHRNDSGELIEDREYFQVKLRNGAFEFVQRLKISYLISLFTGGTIQPSNFAVVKGSAVHLQVEGGSSYGKWKLSDEKIGTIDKSGNFVAQKPGTTTISFGRIETKATVVTINHIEVTKTDTDEYRIEPKPDSSVEHQTIVVYPDDMVYSCSLDPSVNGQIKLVENQSGHFCKVIKSIDATYFEASISSTKGNFNVSTRFNLNNDDESNRQRLGIPIKDNEITIEKDQQTRKLFFFIVLLSFISVIIISWYHFNQ